MRVSRVITCSLSSTWGRGKESSKPRVWIIWWKLLLKLCSVPQKPCCVPVCTALSLKNSLKISWLLLSLARKAFPYETHCRQTGWNDQGVQKNKKQKTKNADINKPIPHCCKPQTQRQQKTWHILCRNAGVSKTQDASCTVTVWMDGGGVDWWWLRGGEGGSGRARLWSIYQSKHTLALYLYSSDAALGITSKTSRLQDHRVTQTCFSTLPSFIGWVSLPSLRLASICCTCD